MFRTLIGRTLSLSSLTLLLVLTFGVFVSHGQGAPSGGGNIVDGNALSDQVKVRMSGIPTGITISSCLDPSNAPSSTRAIVVSLTDAVNHPIKLTEPSLGVVNWRSMGSGGGFHHVCTPFKLLRARTSPLVASLHL